MNMLVATRWFIGLIGMCGAILACNAMEPNVVASQSLTHLRNGTSQYDSFIGYVREEARKGVLTLADVGTSEEELQRLRIKGIKVAASQWLTHLRDGTSQYDSFIGYVREEVRKGDLTLADVGTSEEELASFRFASK